MNIKNAPAVIRNSNWRTKPSRDRDRVYHSLWRKANARNFSFETIYGGQFSSSTQLIILNYPVILSHQHSNTGFFYKLTPLFILLHVVYFITNDYTITTVTHVTKKHSEVNFLFLLKGKPVGQEVRWSQKLFSVKSPSLVSFSWEITRTRTRLHLFMAWFFPYHFHLPLSFLMDPSPHGYILDKVKANSGQDRDGNRINDHTDFDRCKVY